MNGCPRCRRALEECTGHWADDPRSTVVASLATSTGGLIWSDLFPRTEREEEMRKGGG